jgi:hypothetical protein
MSNDMIRYEIATMALWSGVAADTIVVYSERWSSSCGFPMEVGRSYLVFASSYYGKPSERNRDNRNWPGGSRCHSGSVWKAGKDADHG